MTVEKMVSYLAGMMVGSSADLMAANSVEKTAVRSDLKRVGVKVAL